VCFSPEVDVLAAAAISVAAIDAARHTEHPRTAPIALLPALFAVHTFSSALIWWGADGTVPAQIGEAAGQFFLTVAYVVLPVSVPIAMLMLEPAGRHRDALLVLVGAGGLAAAVFAVGLLNGRGSAVTCDSYIAFNVFGAPNAVGVLYVGATCGALLLSSHEPLLRWGAANAVAVALLTLWSKAALPSIWCFWAACTSFFAAWYLRELQQQRARGAPWPWESLPGAPKREQVSR
jgi:hypothetical protein